MQTVRSQPGCCLEVQASLGCSLFRRNSEELSWIPEDEPTSQRPQCSRRTEFLYPKGSFHHPGGPRKVSRTLQTERTPNRIEKLLPTNLKLIQSTQRALMGPLRNCMPLPHLPCEQHSPAARKLSAKGTASKVSESTRTRWGRDYGDVSVTKPSGQTLLSTWSCNELLLRLLAVQEGKDTSKDPTIC